MITDWIPLAVYAVGYVIAARYIARDIINNGEDRDAARGPACCLALFWPFLAALWCLYIASEVIVTLVTWKLPKTDRERREELRRREARVADLERQLGIGGQS